ncbi:MAG: acylphosphatase [Nanoarchaeota archaeon]|nr:acylphosphatase [Nanoarchaeota archaeon]
MKKAIRMHISGSVQGISFRPFVKENAEKLGLKGFVRNLEDGRVEIFIEGNPEEVKKMIEVCSKGPKHAEIREIVKHQEKFQSFKAFKVLHI